MGTRWRQGLVMLVVQMMVLLVVFSSSTSRMVLCTVTSFGALSQTDQFLNERESAVRILAQNVLNLALDTSDCGTNCFHSALIKFPDLHRVSMSIIVLRGFRGFGSLVMYISKCKDFLKGVTWIFGGYEHLRGLITVISGCGGTDMMPKYMRCLMWGGKCKNAV